MQAIVIASRQQSTPSYAETERRSRRKTALVLGSGGYRGAAHIGVIHSLERHSIPVDLVVGTSVGALAGMIYCMGLSSAQLTTALHSLRISDLFSPKDPGDGFTDMEPIRAFIEKTIGFRSDFSHLQRQFACVAADALTGDPVVISEGDPVTAVMSSMALPGLVRPVFHTNRHLVDGAVVLPVPVSAARELGADFVIAVDINEPRHGLHVARNPMESYAHCFDMAIRRLCQIELAAADVVIRPRIDRQPPGSDNVAALLRAGECACEEVIPLIQARLS